MSDSSSTSSLSSDSDSDSEAKKMKQNQQNSGDQQIQEQTQQIPAVDAETLAQLLPQYFAAIQNVDGNTVLSLLQSYPQIINMTYDVPFP